jgi:hypothetical protein
MRLWEEQEKQLEQIGEQLIESFNEKFPEFNAQLFEVENLFRNTWRAANDDTDSQMENIPLVPNDQSYSNLLSLFQFSNVSKDLVLVFSDLIPDLIFADQKIQ